MKILIIEHSSAMNGGVATYLREISSSLQEIGHMPVFAFGTNDKDRVINFPSSVFIPGLTTYSATTNINSTKRLTELIGSEKPQVAFINICNNSSVIELISKDIPTILFLHVPGYICVSGTKMFTFPKPGICSRKFNISCIVNYYLRRCGNYRPFSGINSYIREKKCLNSLSGLKKILVASNYMRNLLISEGISEEKILTLAYPVASCGCDDFSASNKLDCSLLLFVGRLSESKGVHYLLRAVKKIDKPYKLLIVGDGYYRNYLERLSIKLNLSEKVKFTGWLKREEICELYKQCRVVVMPSLWPEAFGIVGIEAMRHGRPVVGFNTGAIPEWLDDGKTGLLAKYGDVHDLAEKIAFFLKNPQKACEMGERSRSIAVVSYDREIYRRNLMEVFYDSIKG